MSFILDALRKSERERQSNQEPGVAQLWTHGKRGNRAFWIPLVMLLVGLNLSLLVFLWIKGSPEPAEETTTINAVNNTAATRPAAVNPEPVISAGQMDQSSRRLSSEIVAEEAAAPLTANTARPAPAVPQTRSDNSDPYKNLPSLMELALAGSIDLPPMRLDIHVYSEQPAERFVFINMKKYREGDPLVEGPVLEAITSQGVVLNQQGRSFILTRE